MNKPARSPISRRRKRTRRGPLFYLLLIAGFSVFSLFLGGASLFLYYSYNLPDYKPLKDRHTNAYSVVYSEEDEVIGKFLMDNRIPIPYEKLPKNVINAFIAAEDASFFHHSGIDYKGIARALLKNLLAGRVVQGGSTITQQVTKTFFLTPQRSFLRKVKEAAYAFGLERNLSKEEILSLYLNNIYLGNGAYGLEAAAESYFNKRVEQLSLAETALIAGIVKAPSRYSPASNLRRARERQGYVLGRMAELGYITPAQKEQALRTPLRIQARENAYFSKAPYFTEYVRHYVERRYGKEKVYQEGLRIYTTFDLTLQRAAQRAVESRLRDLDKRQGFRGPLRRVAPSELRELAYKASAAGPLSSGELFDGVVLSADDAKKLYLIWAEDRRGVLAYGDMAWALTVKPSATFKPGKIKNPGELLHPGDVVSVRLKDPSRREQPLQFLLDQEPAAQAALVCIDPRSGHVKAMVGGRDFGESQFNRAIQSRRQPGSAFKPLIYAAAIEKGYTPSTILMDSPVEYTGTDGGSYWAPKNYDKHFLGPITFRNALAHSRNVVTVKILEHLGLGFTLAYAKKLGIESPLKRDLSIALGSSGVSMMEISSAFAVFANGGEKIKPIFIRKIATLQGEVLEENTPYVDIGEEGVEENEPKEEDEATPKTEPEPQPPVRERVITPQNAYIMTHLLEGVIQHGTGMAARVLGRPVAGKTGTSNDYTDAWFIGYTPSVLTSVWVGFDDKSSLGNGETGARAALPIWIAFMEQALKNEAPEPFKPPPGVVMTRVDLETGKPVESDGPGTIMEAFLEGHVPTDKDEGKEAPPQAGR
jgi:penicillin-binding protein 1A